MTPDNFQIKLENLRLLKTVEIPSNELEVFDSIDKFVSELREQEIEDQDILWSCLENKQEVQSIFEKKKSSFNQEGLKEDEITKRLFLLRRESEYESLKSFFDYKNEQLQKIVSFLDSQKIWKNKFTTAANIPGYERWLADSEGKDVAEKKFKERLNMSDEIHKQNTYAGQNTNSIYYISESGACIRVKAAELYDINKIHQFGSNLEKVVLEPNEVFTCVDDHSDEDYSKKYGVKKDGYDICSKEYTSFAPIIGNRVVEYSQDLNQASLTELSPIKIFEDGKLLKIQNTTNVHWGHCINKIYF